MHRVRPARAAGIAVILLLGGAATSPVGAHGLSQVYQSPLPLAVYLVGAGLTVALSFAFILARDLRAVEPPIRPGATVPGIARVTLRVIGLFGWAWIMVQGIAGGSSDASVAGLFLWVYGWVGLAMVSALVFPAWEWLDPFATLFDMGAFIIRRLGIRPWAPAPLPAGARHWPAFAGMVFFTWLELVAVPGAQTLAVVLGGYTVMTLALMAQFGRDTWRTQGETFTVWFRTLNRLAPLGVPGARDGTLVRRSFGSGLLDAAWTTPVIGLVAVGTGGIIFDGISQTIPFAAVFGAPQLLAKSALLLGWLAMVSGLALLVGRTVSPGAIGAGLLPISVGYLVAHYLTYLLIDGQRIVIAVSDPLQQGADLLGTAFYEPQAGWLPPGLVWTAQLVAVVGGHMLGAWAGHVTAQRDMDGAQVTGRSHGARTGANGHPNGHANGHPNGNGAKQARDIRHRRIHEPAPILSRNVRAREIPLAIVMVALTTLTLWSLGQAIVVEPAEGTRPDAIALIGR